MCIIELIILFGVMAAMAATPSASVALVVTRSATLGVVNGLAVSVGIVVGDLVFVAFAMFGLSVAAETMGSLFMVIKVLGGLYLLWLGFSLLTAKHSAKSSVSKSSKNGSLAASFVAGLFLTLGDVKATIFYASVLPIFIDLSAIEIPEVIAIIIITMFSVGGVKFIYAIFARKVAACIKNANMEVAVRKTGGSLLIGAGSYLIAKA